MADVRTWKSGYTGVTIEIDYDKCEGEGTCVEICPVQVFELVNDKSAAPNIDECIECCACIPSCPTGAITHSSC
ncbi:MAG: ferredoxin family protein [Candidatus Bathyarchaeia archaeon]